MATVTQQRPRPALPERQIKQFPARSASYRALSIIDAYSSDLLVLPQLAEHREEVKSAPLLDRNEGHLRSRKDSLKDSYARDFDIDEAYGSGDAELYEDDMDEIINLDEYDPYRSTTPPPRTSSKQPIISAKFETKIEIVEVKPEPPPKPRNGDYDPFKAASPPKRNPARLAMRDLASRSEPLLAAIEKLASSPAVPPKDVPRAIVNGSLLAATKSSSQLSTVSTPRSANTDKALPTVPSLPRKLLASPLEKLASKDERTLPKPSEQSNSKVQAGLPSRPNEGVKEKRDTRKDSLMQSEKGM